MKAAPVALNHWWAALLPPTSRHELHVLYQTGELVAASYRWPHSQPPWNHHHTVWIPPGWPRIPPTDQGCPHWFTLHLRYHSPRRSPPRCDHHSLLHNATCIAHPGHDHPHIGQPSNTGPTLTLQSLTTTIQPVPNPQSRTLRP